MSHNLAAENLVILFNSTFGSFLVLQFFGFFGLFGLLVPSPIHSTNHGKIYFTNLCQKTETYKGGADIIAPRMMPSPSALASGFQLTVNKGGKGGREGGGGCRTQDLVGTVKFVR